MKRISSLLILLTTLLGLESHAQLMPQPMGEKMPNLERVKKLPTTDIDLSSKRSNWLERAPKGADQNAGLYYNRPAGAFASNLLMCVEDYGTPVDIYGIQIDNILTAVSGTPYLFMKPYSGYQFNGLATGMSPDAVFSWDYSTLDDEVVTMKGNKDLTVNYGIGYVDAPIFKAEDNNESYEYQMGGNYTYEDGTSSGFLPALLISHPEPYRPFTTPDPYDPWLVGFFPLLSSKNFGLSWMRGHDSPLMTFSGAKPYGKNHKGWWFGKNAGHAGICIDGIAQAFEKPSHPYKLVKPVLAVSSLEVTGLVQLKCKVYKLDEIPDYEENAAVTLPEVPGELIATGVAQVSEEQVRRLGDGNVFVFTLYQEVDGEMVEVTPTIDFPILITIDGYNDPDMANLVDFTAMASSDLHVDEGFGELAYIKVGNAFAADHQYVWTGLNNFYSGGNMMTGLSIFITAEFPIIQLYYDNDDGQYLFPDEGGWMQKSLTDDEGRDITMSGIEVAAWTPSTSGQWTITCNGEPLPDWLEVSLTDRADENGNFNYQVNAQVKANPLPAGMNYREALVRFEYPGAYLDYLFMQGIKPAPDVTIQPEITFSTGEEAVFVRATGRGQVVLKIDGMTVENPYPVIRGDEDKTVIATATAQETGKEISDITTLEIPVPARIFPPTAPPSISYRMTDDAVIITAQGEGDVLLYLDGNQVDNPCTCMRDDQDRTVLAAATAQGYGKLLSEMVEMEVVIPAKEKPVPQVSDPPMISYQLSDEVALVKAVGLGDIVLKIDGVEVDNPYSITRGDKDATVLATATAQEAGKLVSDIVTRRISIPARVVPPESPNSLAMPNVGAQAGSTIVIPVSLFNSEAIAAFQTDVCLPEGFELQYTDGNFAVMPSSRVPDSHSLMCNSLEDGAVRVLCYSTGVEPLLGNSGELFYLTVFVPDDARGEYSITLKNTRLTTMNLQELMAPDVASTIDVSGIVMGDANSSGVVTVTDVMTTAAHVMQEQPYPFDPVAANVNLDNDVSVTDIALIARYVMNPNKKFPSRAPQRVTTGDNLIVNDATIAAGQSVPVNVGLNNQFGYSSFQLDITLPNGLTASNFTLSSRAADHTLLTRRLADGRIRVLCYSMQTRPLSGSSGTLFSFDLTATGYASGTVTMDGIEFVTSACGQVTLDDTRFLVLNSSSVTDVNADVPALRAHATRDGIVVDSPCEQWITVSDVLGRTIARHRVPAGRTQIPVTTTGFIIVGAQGHQAVKLFLGS